MTQHNGRHPTLLERLGRVVAATLRLPVNIAAMTGSARSIDERLDKLEMMIERLAAREIPAPVVNILPDPKPNGEQQLFNALADSALRRTVQIIETEMPHAVIYYEHAAFMKACVGLVRDSGAFCEFGVYSGTTINFIADLRPDAQIDGFDSFRGLPSEWSGYVTFDFDRAGTTPVVRPNVRLHVGWFDDTLPAYAKTIGSVAFLHIDCDLYSSTRTVFQHLGPKLMRGCVIVFDEYFHYPGFEHHERRAFAEFLRDSGRRAQWIKCCGQRAACVLDGPLD